MKGPLLSAAAVGLVAAGVVLGGMLWRENAGPGSRIPDPGSRIPDPGSRIPDPASHVPDPASRVPDPGSRIPDPGTITLTPEMIARAGIKSVPAIQGTATMRLQLPGIVAPNAYKDVDVTSLVSGRLTQVSVELGQTVTLGQTLATVYSPELADTQTAFIAAVAEHIAHDQQQARTQRLYAIGAASRQELELLEARRSEMDAKVETLRARLVLLGVPEERTQRVTNRLDVVTTFDVKAPIPGSVTKRNANPGLNVDPATPLFTVTDLSTVWVIADLYERDFADVRVGSPATITTASYPGLSIRGRVSYIDPQVQAETRTAKLRIEVPNAGNRLRFGMFVDVAVGGTPGRPVVLVPKAALQSVGSTSVVYLAGEHGQFTARTVIPGETTGDTVAITTGLQPGDPVVTDGAFFLRAEHARASPDLAGSSPPTGVKLPATRP
jgi:cobalt-zinc-cadmium efflux system membrane fusion protein